MSRMRGYRSVSSVTLLAALLLMAPVAGAAVKFRRLSDVNGTTAPAVAMTRTANGTLHLVYQTYAGRSLSGLATMSISKAGSPGPQVQATTWTAGQPGLVAFPSGSIEAFFGAISPPPSVSSVWGITSANGGATWSPPVDVKAGGPNESLAYGSDVTATIMGTTPVLMLPQAGNLVVQEGLGPGSPNYQVTNSSDGSASDANLAVDAATGRVVAGWQSLAGSGSDYLEGVAPSLGAVQAVPGQLRNALNPSGRDKGAGVFAAYTPDGVHVRLLRYGGGSVAVGSLSGLSAKVLGTATGLNGRIWVMWGTDSGAGIAVTRSNQAVTRFEPIQHFDPKIFSIWRMSGDGRLGPLDLFLDMIPNTKGAIPPPGNYYARVLPVLSASVKVAAVKNKKGQVVAHKLTVTVTDAGDPVAGATVSAKSKKAKTNSAGVAKLTLTGSGKTSVTITDPGYNVLTLAVKL